jgi:hypothetical protein
MICCLLIYQTCYELFVNYNFLVLVWIWLHACLLYDSKGSDKATRGGLNVRQSKFLEGTWRMSQVKPNTSFF